jgi:hypothetical protein
VITVAPKGRGAFGDVFGGLSTAMNTMVARYSAAEQQVIADWVTRTIDILREQTRELSRRTSER